jgi:hypothetical protein
MVLIPENSTPTFVTKVCEGLGSPGQSSAQKSGTLPLRMFLFPILHSAVDSGLLIGSQRSGC